MPSPSAPTDPVSSSAGRHEVHVALRVTDEAGYQAYRDEMTPILASMGGFFRYDMRVSELLQGHAEEPPNRAFVLSFPDEPTKARFFGDPGYQQARERHFDRSVGSVVIVAAYTLPPA